MCAESSPRSSRVDGMGLVTCESRTAAGVSRQKARGPVSISYATMATSRGLTLTDGFRRQPARATCTRGSPSRFRAVQPAQRPAILGQPEVRQGTGVPSLWRRMVRRLDVSVQDAWRARGPARGPAARALRRPHRKLHRLPTRPERCRPRPARRRVCQALLVPESKTSRMLGASAATESSCWKRSAGNRASSARNPGGP